jgi:hypothetical protein
MGELVIPYRVTVNLMERLALAAKYYNFVVVACFCLEKGGMRANMMMQLDEGS